MKYKTIYSFEVMSAIEDGQKVYMLDRKYIVTANVSNLTVGELVEIFKHKDEEPNRFEFWKEIETEEKENA